MLSWSASRWWVSAVQSQGGDDGGVSMAEVLVLINVAEIVYSNIWTFFFESLKSFYPVFKVLDFIYCSLHG